MNDELRDLDLVELMVWVYEGSVDPRDAAQEITRRIAAEREACAQIADGMATRIDSDAIAGAIRARGSA